MLPKSRVRKKEGCHPKIVVRYVQNGQGEALSKYPVRSKEKEYGAVEDIVKIKHNVIVGEKNIQQQQHQVLEDERTPQKKEDRAQEEPQAERVEQKWIGYTVFPDKYDGKRGVEKIPRKKWTLWRGTNRET